MPDAFRCPRCGYDQTGVVAAWRTSCAVRGVCSECGVEWWWGDVLDPVNLGPLWSFGHGRLSVARWIDTSVLTLQPARLWRSLAREHSGRAARFVLFAASWMALMHGLAAVVAGLWGTQLGAPWWAWPYASSFEVPTGNPNTLFVAEFASVAVLVCAMSAGPPLALLVVAAVVRLSIPAIARATALFAPAAAVGLVVGVGHFYGLTWLEARRAAGGPDAIRAASLLTLLAYPAWTWWYWRCWLRHYAGVRGAGAWATVLVLLAAVAMFGVLERLES